MQNYRSQYQEVSLLLHIADVLLYTIHVVVIGINLFGWIFKRSRRIQLITILATTFSWFIMGIWYGWGYCFLTDWEWDIKRQLGETGLPNSFVHYMANRSLGLDLSVDLLDDLTIITFIIALIAGLVVNYRDIKKTFYKSRN